jgi:hypothetical protein
MRSARLVAINWSLSERGSNLARADYEVILAVYPAPRPTQYEDDPRWIRIIGVWPPGCVSLITCGVMMMSRLA